VATAVAIHILYPLPSIACVLPVCSRSRCEFRRNSVALTTLGISFDLNGFGFGLGTSVATHEILSSCRMSRCTVTNSRS
jgi:hypothetical protein